MILHREGEICFKYLCRISLAAIDHDKKIANAIVN